MFIKRVADQKTNELRAKEFFDEIDKVMNRPFQHINALVFHTLDRIYNLVSNDEVSVGYCVYNAPENGLAETDLFLQCSLEDYRAAVDDATNFTGSDISFFNIEASRKTFLSLLAQQVTTNIPTTLPEAIRHVKMQVASLFNGFNFYQVRFELVYIDTSLFDEDYFSTSDLGDLLVV